MISRLHGTLLTRKPGIAEIMTASGVGYEVLVPLTVYERLPREGSTVELRIEHVFRDNAITLYGFIEEGERSVFARLLTATGVGPRLALNVLSTLSPERLLRAIVEKDIPTLRKVPGLGTKKAEKLIVELADRLDDLAIVTTTGRRDTRGAEEAIAALIALGYSPAAATAAVRRVLDADGSLAGTEKVIRAALGSISSA